MKIKLYFTSQTRKQVWKSRNKQEKRLDYGKHTQQRYQKQRKFGKGNEEKQYFPTQIGSNFCNICDDVRKYP